jgi:hypothetical protein
MVMRMNALNAHQKRFAGLARSVRAAIIVPSLLALALLVIKNREMAGFAVFGTFAHLVVVDYDSSRRARSAECAMLTLLGAVMISVGTLVSANIWWSVGGAIAAGNLNTILQSNPKSNCCYTRGFASVIHAGGGCIRSSQLGVATPGGLAAGRSRSSTGIAPALGSAA